MFSYSWAKQRLAKNGEMQFLKVKLRIDDESENHSHEQWLKIIKKGSFLFYSFNTLLQIKTKEYREIANTLTAE